MRPRGDPMHLEERRIRAVQMVVRRDMPQVAVAQRVGVSPRMLNTWVQQFRREGQDSLKARPNHGRPPRLRQMQRRRLESILLKGAGAAGFATDLWTCPRVNRVIEQEFDISYHVDHIGRLLHALGWSPQKPERRAMERDEKAIRKWIKQEWPRIKKKPGG